MDNSFKLPLDMFVSLLAPLPPSAIISLSCACKKLNGAYESLIGIVILSLTVQVYFIQIISLGMTHSFFVLLSLSLSLSFCVFFPSLFLFLSSPLSLSPLSLFSPTR